MNYIDYLSSKEWAELKFKKLSYRDKGCAFCLSKEGLELHHLFYRKDLSETQPEDLRWLCCRCHQLVHDLINYGKIDILGKTAEEIYKIEKKAILKKIRFGLPDVKTRSEINKLKKIEKNEVLNKKQICRKIKRKSPIGQASKNEVRFRKDHAVLKYLERAEKSKNFKFTRRTIAELSPWNIKMVKAILRKDVVDIKSALNEILEKGATIEEVQLACSFSSIYERLAKMKYGNYNK